MTASMEERADEPPSPIDLELEVDAPPDRVWALLTDPRLVGRWLTDASAVERVGDPYRLDFGEGSVVDGVVAEFEPGVRFAYTFAWVGSEAHEETYVEWSVEPVEDGGTVIRLVHDGWAEAGIDESVRDDHEGSWASYLHELAAVLDGAAPA
jgi:uncharacterized protein YndB with AHSA1/START domain